MSEPGNSLAVSVTDGPTQLWIRRSDGTRQKLTQDGTVGIHRADGQWREVLRFDEPSRPHSVASNGIAEYGGWMYFTLSDFESDIWVATVKGLKK